MLHIRNLEEGVELFKVLGSDIRVNIITENTAQTPIMVRRNTRAGEIRHRSWINQEKGGKSDAAYQKFG